MRHTIVSSLVPVVGTLLLGVVAGWRGDEDARAARAQYHGADYALPWLLFARGYGDHLAQ
jgi:hypothetical protein